MGQCGRLKQGNCALIVNLVLKTLSIMENLIPITERFKNIRDVIENGMDSNFSDDERLELAKEGMELCQQGYMDLDTKDYMKLNGLIRNLEVKLQRNGNRRIGVCERVRNKFINLIERL